MRVVQVANFYGPRSGGLRTAVDRLGAEYSAAGHEVFLIVPGRHAEHSELSTGVVRITVPAKLIPFTGGYRAVLPGPVRTLLQSLLPDTLEVSDRLTLRSLGRWGRDHGATTVMISHERLDRLAGQVLPRRTARRFADFANRRTAANYDTVVCTPGLPAKNSIASARRIPSPFRSAWTSTPSTRRVARPSSVSAGPHRTRYCWCTAADCRWKKRADRSIDAVAALCDAGVEARLVVVGDGPLRARLQRQAARLPVDFTGFISDRHSVAELLASADVALAPGPHETFGLAALESLACGTPAVVSRTSALGEIITADSGALADNNPTAIAEAVTAIVSRPEEHRRAAARRRAEMFTWQRAAVDMLTTLGATSFDDDPGDSQHTA